MLAKLQLCEAVERVLHSKGNYRGGILEMAIVFDCNIPLSLAEDTAKELVTILKKQSEIFRNVRLNVIQWRSDTEFIKEVSSLPQILIGSYFENYTRVKEEKTLEFLTLQLKKFYARSKLIFLLTEEGGYTVRDRELYEASRKPFLEKKLVLITVDEQKEKTVIEYPMKLQL